MKNNEQNTQHTPGPWKAMACPMHAGKHPFHDSRWIATDDAEVEFGNDPRSWRLSRGSLICEMRDGPIANARLIAAAPELLDALSALLDAAYDNGATSNDLVVRMAHAAIAKATGKA